MRTIRLLFRDNTARFFAKVLCIGSLGGAIVFGVLGTIGYLAKAQLYKEGNLHPQTWKEFVFTIAGGLDAAADANTASVIYAVALRLLATILIGGLVTSLFCALAERIGDMKLQGLLPARLTGHYIIVGMSPCTAELVRVLLDSSTGNDLVHWNPQKAAPSLKRRRVLICTNSHVEEARVALCASLPPSLFSRVSFVSGDIHASGMVVDSLFSSLNLQSARQLYVLEESEKSHDSTIAILSFAQRAMNFLDGHPSAFGPIPIYVQLAADTPFEFYRDIAASKISRGGLPSAHLVPICFSEGWARRMWGTVNSDWEFVPDFAGLSGKRYVHIVIAGLSDTGYAMVHEAIRVCHFSNGYPTCITIVDPSHEAHQRFLVRHPTLHLLPDIHLDWVEDRIESDVVRDLLRKIADDGNCLLTVAVCLSNDDKSLGVALSLPEEIYRHRLEGKAKTIRDRYRENGPRVLVLQRGREVTCAVSKNPRFQYIRPFGMQEGCFAQETTTESSAMLLNAVYAWPDISLLETLAHTESSVARRIAEFQDKWKSHLFTENGQFSIPVTERLSLLQDILAGGGQKVRKLFRENAFRAWLALPSALRMANVYAPDSWGVLLRELGLRSQRSAAVKSKELFLNNCAVFHDAISKLHSERSLDETEHKRWMADRLLLGYRPPRPGTGETRDDDFLYHPDIVPFGNLSITDVNKDEMALSSIPVLLAMEGFCLTTFSPIQSRTSANE